MCFIADLHVHSYLSRATSRQMNLENLYKWAQLKGVTVVGTGDFTHPKWFFELQQKLEPAEPGLFKLKDEYCSEVEKEIPDSCRAPVRFLLTAEISTIYKKLDKTRKVHSVILSPDLFSAGKLNAALQEIGNIKSDGRPIIGMDCKKLLQMTLDASPENTLIPAHIWTPHFSVLGAASGFDSIEECFEDLTSEIFALETGLSSDPRMNWNLSSLDRFVLVSNSDAHSPAKLAREANIFSCELSYFAMMKALRKKDPNGFKGTIEFYPEEGKYHYDGHRGCKMPMKPDETIRKDGKCPSCGKKVTIGVLHRVSLLSDRRQNSKPPKAFGFESLVPLVEILSEINSVGVNSKKINIEYLGLLERFGNELKILRNCSLSELKQAGYSTLSEAIGNMREGRVSVIPGYDGEYGTVSVCNHVENRKSQLPLF